MRRLSAVRARPLRILLVDDSDDDVFLARAAFAACDTLGIVHVARSGLEAMAYLQREGNFGPVPRPDLILVDVNMPEINGFDLLAMIKGDPRHRAIPVVMLTVSLNDDDVGRAYLSGAASYIRKPSSFEQFEALVQRFAEYWTEVASVPGP